MQKCFLCVAYLWQDGPWRQARGFCKLLFIDMLYDMLYIYYIYVSHIKIIYTVMTHD